MHKLLERQLTRLSVPPDGPRAPADWRELLGQIDRTYADADRDRYMLERSLALSSEEMRVLHEQLRSERDKLRVVFESAALGILSIDGDGRILDANPAATRMLGVAREHLVGTALAPAFFDAAVDDEALAHGPHVAGECHLERPDGETRWFTTTTTWVRGPSGSTQLGTVIFEDVTERKRLERDLVRAQRLESVGRLAAGVAHELNTPVQFISDNVHFLGDAFASVVVLVERLAEIAAQGGDEALARCREAELRADWEYLGDEVPASIAQTLDGLRRVATIVHSMKAFAHVDHDEQAPSDLNAALARTLAVAARELAGVAVATEEYGELPPVTCCVADLNRVFLDLIVNAAHAIRDVACGTGELGKISITTWRDGAHAVVSIADSGPGIPDHVAARIFEPFVTTKDVGRGSGQGLALAHGVVVKKHGGAISFETALGLGTTFTIRLPIAGVPRAEAA